MKLFKKNIYIIGNRPEADWHRIFAVMVILVIIISIYNAVFYKKIESENSVAEVLNGHVSTGVPGTASTSRPTATSVTATSKTVEEYSKTDVNYIIDLYRTRNIKYLRALADYGR